MNNLFQEYPGEIQVLLSAGHAFPQVREGSYKPRDLYTGELVGKLCEETGCWGLVTTKMQEDPNWYEDSPFRIKIKKLIEEKKINLVLDIHGKKNDGESVMDFYPNMMVKNIGNLKMKGARIIHFKNDEQLTIAEDLGGAGVACIEIEINEEGRTAGTRENRLVAKYLREIIQNVD